MPDLNDAISAAVASVKEETSIENNSEAKAEPEVNAEEPKKGDPEPKADDEPEEEFYNPTAAELAAIEKSPELKKAYRALRAGFTKKTQEIAGERKTLKERADLATWIQENPAEAARTLAQLSGLSIAEQKKEETKVADELEDEWAKTVGTDAAKLLRPVIEKTAERIVKSVLEPIAKQTEELAAASNERGIAAGVREFGASIVERGDEWSDEIAKEMAVIVNKIEPAEGTTLQDILDIAYDKAMAIRTRSKNSRENLARLKRIRSEQEPTTTARSGEATPARIDGRMSERDAIAAAVAAARGELGVR